MYFKQIISLLSNHRNKELPKFPTTLSKTQIVSLVAASLPPDRSPDNITTTIAENLKELEAQGEINGGIRNRYCIAPPTVLAPAKDNLTGLLFRGDRAYLPSVHKILNTQQEPTEIKIIPQINNFDLIKNKLDPIGINLLTVEQSIQSLPLPKIPSKVILRSPYSLNPFDNLVLEYFPQDNFHTQSERWREIIRDKLTNKSLLQLISQEYLWFEDDEFYELERDRANLTMFALDKETQHPLLIPWDEPEGKLHLKGVSLPGTYAKWLWSLSEPVKDPYRTRYIKSQHRPLIKSAFKRLGSHLV